MGKMVNSFWKKTVRKNVHFQCELGYEKIAQVDRPYFVDMEQGFCSNTKSLLISGHK